jgi:hypothetical protein
VRMMGLVRLSSQYMVGMTRGKEAVLSPESAGLAGGNECGAA